MEKKREISIAKGVAIILMLLGHIFINKETQHIHDFIYSFHMPFFFIISGYCFSEHHLNNPKQYIKKRINTLYFPYVFWLSIFAFLHNDLLNSRIYDINDLWGCAGLYTRHDLISNLYNIVFYLDGKEILVGQLWFIRTLFFAVIAVFFLIKYFRNYLNKLMFVFIMISPFVCYINFNKIPYLHFTNWVYIGIILYYIGYFYKKNDKLQHGKLIISLCGAIFLIYLAIRFPITHPDYKTIYIYIATSLLGFELVFFISRILIKIDKLEIFDYIGNHTISILILHFIFFRLLTLIIIKLRNDNIQLLSFHPLPEQYVHIYWALYLIIGIVLPIIIQELYRISKNYILKLIKQIMLMKYTINKYEQYD